MKLSAQVSRIKGKSIEANLLVQALEEASKEVDDTIEKIVIDFCFSVIDSTPFGMPESWGSYWRAVRGVDAGQYTPGHLKFNWQFSKTMPTQELDGEDSRNGTAAKTRVQRNIDGDGTYYFYNTADYAYEIEMGYSRQAPQGMLRINVAQWPSFVNKHNK